MRPLQRHTRWATGAILVAFTGCGFDSPDPTEPPPPGDSSGLIAFDTRRDGSATREVSHIYLMNADGTGVRRLSDMAELSDFQPTWSPDGQKIAFVSYRNGDVATQIYVMNADGSGQTRLTNDPTGNAQPAWSPDGKRIAFSTRRDGNTEIYVMNADGTAEIRLTNTAGDDYWPAWSPDGEKIVYSSGDGQLYLMNADGTGQTRLTAGSSAAWSPDGSTIAFSGYGIYIMKSDGTGQRRLSTTNYDGFPSWSRDGRKLAFMSERSGNWEIFVINADGSGETNITKHPADDFNPAWQP